MVLCIKRTKYGILLAVERSIKAIKNTVYVYNIAETDSEFLRKLTINGPFMVAN